MVDGGCKRRSVRADSRRLQRNKERAGRHLEDVIGGNPDYARHGIKIGTVLYLWKKFGPDNEMVNFLTNRIANNPTDAIMLLDAFIGRAWGLESGLSHKSQFDRSEFDAAASLIDPNVLLTALKTTFGELMDDVDFDKCWQLEGDQQTACRFAAIFNKVREENAQKQSSADSGPIV